MRSRVLLDLLPDRFSLLLEQVGLLQSMIRIGLLDLGFGLATLCKRSSLHVGRLRFQLLVDLRYQSCPYPRESGRS